MYRPLILSITFDGDTYTARVRRTRGEAMVRWTRGERPRDVDRDEGDALVEGEGRVEGHER